MHVFDVAVAFAFVAEAEDHAWDFDESQGHVVGRAVHHFRQVVAALFGFALRLAGVARSGKTLGFFRIDTLGFTAHGVDRSLTRGSNHGRREIGAREGCL